MKLVISDRWNSIKFLHDIENKYGIETQQYSMKYDDFYVIKSYIDDSSFIFPKLERPVDMEDLFHIDLESYPMSFNNQPCAHLLFQIMTVKEGAKTIDKGENLTDDIFRSVALLGISLLDEDNRKMLRHSVNRQKQSGVVGVSVGLSGGITHQQPSGAGGSSNLAALGVVRSYQ